ncbi:MAG: MipA/OmpV family protein [Gammaproteobacteria bacterium]|jgi:outer membrane protein
MKILLLAFLVTISSMAEAAEIRIQLFNSPSDGQVVFQVYNSANSFGGFRNPVKEVRFPINDDGEYIITEVSTGKIAVVGYHDANENGILDKNFIGIPKEPVGLSNNYRPKGPPSFERASFVLDEMQSINLDIELFQILGARGQWGVGIGMIGKTAPYLNASQSSYQIIPAVTYIGERLQIFGPNLKFGLVGSGKARLALSAEYRIGAYDENDSDFLLGMGNRRSTLMSGLSFQYELPQGLELELGYQHDILDRIGGGIANVNVSRGFQYKFIRVSPEVSLTWLSKQISNHDFGIPIEAATANRNAYALGSTINLGLGISSFIELSERWQLIVNIKGDLLPDEITNSPIVADDAIFSGFAAITYVF